MDLRENLLRRPAKPDRLRAAGTFLSRRAATAQRRTPEGEYDVTYPRTL